MAEATIVVVITQLGTTTIHPKCMNKFIKPMSTQRFPLPGHNELDFLLVYISHCVFTQLVTFFTGKQLGEYVQG